MENAVDVPTLNTSQIIPGSGATISAAPYAPPAPPTPPAPTAPAALDLASLVIAEATTIEILHPVNGKPIGMTVTVYGKDSQPVKKILAEQSSRRLAKIEAEGKGYTLTSVSPKERENDALELLAGSTKAWTNAVFGGKYLDCTFDNAVDLYVKLPWLREQIDTAIDERQRFIKG